jgi:phenylalanyl-tRNA synthetase beta chain
LHPGRTAQVSLRREGAADAPFLVAGVVGELHPEVLERWEIRADRVVAGELALAGLSGGGLRAVKASAVPRFPVVERDIAVVVAGDRPSSEIQELIRDAAGPLLADVRLFDVYPMPDGDRSLAFRVSLQPIERTLTDAEIDEVMADTVGALERNGARLRG